MQPDEKCPVCDGPAVYGCVSIGCPYPMDNPLIDRTYVDWQEGEPPKEQPGQYLVWLGGKYAKDRELAVYNIQKGGVGFLRFINGHFAFDYLDKDCYIVAWAPPPRGPDASILG